MKFMPFHACTKTLHVYIFCTTFGRRITFVSLTLLFWYRDDLVVGGQSFTDTFTGPLLECGKKKSDFSITWKLHHVSGITIGCVPGLYDVEIEHPPGLPNLNHAIVQSTPNASWVIDGKPPPYIELYGIDFLKLKGGFHFFLLKRFSRES